MCTQQHGQTDGQTDTQTNGKMHRQVDGRADRWTRLSDGRTAQTDSQAGGGCAAAVDRTDRQIDSWSDGQADGEG